MTSSIHTDLSIQPDSGRADAIRARAVSATHGPPVSRPTVALEPLRSEAPVITVAKRKGSGKRTGALERLMESAPNLGRDERQQMETVARLLDDITSKTRPGSPDLTVASTRQAFSARLLSGLKAGRTRFKAKAIAKPDTCVEALARSGLDALLLETWSEGQLAYSTVSKHLSRLGHALQDAALTPADVKFGILALDGVLQRLALVVEPNHRFKYATGKNHARDSLITFARSLHR